MISNVWRSRRLLKAGQYLSRHPFTKQRQLCAPEGRKQTTKETNIQIKKEDMERARERRETGGWRRGGGGGGGGLLTGPKADRCHTATINLHWLIKENFSFLSFSIVGVTKPLDFYMLFKAGAKEMVRTTTIRKRRTLSTQFPNERNGGKISGSGTGDMILFCINKIQLLAWEAKRD